MPRMIFSWLCVKEAKPIIWSPVTKVGCLPLHVTAQRGLCRPEISRHSSGDSRTILREGRAMAVYKQPKSKYWWFKFVWNGKPIRESTKQTNRRIAEQMEAARRTQLAKG